MLSITKELRSLFTLGNSSTLRHCVLCAVAIALGMWSRSAYADCGGEHPTITAVEHQTNATSVTVRWHWVGETFCAFPADFYQVRWTKGEGPGTQSQSPRIDTSNNDASFVIGGIDPKAVYGFIVQACVNKTLAPADCTQWSPMAYYKPYGPGTCRSGFVWRAAFSGDEVCVTPQTRRETVADNAAGPGRRKADGTCISGFVWRAARASDLVCVTPAMRSQAAADNAQAISRALPPP